MDPESELEPCGRILEIPARAENRIGFTTIVPGPAARLSAVPTLILKAQALSSADPENLVVVLDRQVKRGSTAGPGTTQDLKALLQWGIGGAQHEALVDFLNGTIVSVPASTMKVSAVYTVGAGTAPFGPDYIVSVSLGYGTRPTNGQIPSASFTTTLQPDGDPALTLQRWATAVQLLFDPPGVAGNVEMRDFNDQVLYTLPIVNGAIVPVVNQATHLAFVHDAASPAVSTVTFRELLAF